MERFEVSQEMSLYNSAIMELGEAFVETVIGIK